ncbi:hypothetical protein CEP88_16435 [Roseobacter denitrificans]|nr:hypothetical protein CEP88_16435 [Roseobacter denitrificans]
MMLSAPPFGFWRISEANAHRDLRHKGREKTAHQTGRAMPKRFVANLFSHTPGARPVESAARTGSL